MTRLRDPRTPGRYTLEALLPYFEQWLQRPHGQLTFRVTQVLFGHGCLGEYLHRIGKVPTPSCEHCNDGIDTALHTLRDCVAWSDQRATLQDTLGMDLSLSGVVAAILDSEIKWKTFALFCEQVMLAKEIAERARQAADAAAT